MFLAIGELLLDVTIAPQGPLRADDDNPAGISMAGGGQAANFAAWAAALGEPARLVTRIGADESGRRLVAEIEAGGVEVLAVEGADPTGVIAVMVGPAGERTLATQRGASVGLRPEDLREEWFAGVQLLHLPAYSLFGDPLAQASRRAVELARAEGALISIDLSSAAGIEAYGGARLATDLERIRPELLFATEAEAAAIAVPLEGLAKVPVLKLGVRGCRVFGRLMAAPRVEVADGTGAGDALAAAFCAAYVDGATPLEAAGRALLVSARALAKRGARP